MRFSAVAHTHAAQICQKSINELKPVIFVYHVLYPIAAFPVSQEASSSHWMQSCQWLLGGCLDCAGREVELDE